MVRTQILLPPDIKEKLRHRYDSISDHIRQLITMDLEGDTTRYNAVISRDDWRSLKRWIDESPALQVCGDIQIGKSTALRRVIANCWDEDPKFCVLDAHNEYRSDGVVRFPAKLKEVKGIPPTKPSRHCRVVLPHEEPAAKGIFPLYASQWLSRPLSKGKWPVVLIIEEAHRYASIDGLLRECGKFGKIIAVTQRPVGTYANSVLVVK